MRRIKGLILVLLIGHCFAFAQNDLGKVEVGEGMPEFRLYEEDGREFTIGTRLNKVMLIHFFHLWDDSTRPELEGIKTRIWDAYKDYTNFGLLAIGVENTDEQLQEYKDREDIPFQLYADPVGETFALFALGETLPHTYVVDVDNKVVFLLKGYSPEGFIRLEKEISKLLNATPIFDDPLQTEQEEPHKIFYN